MREEQNHIEEFWTQPESRRLEFKEQFPGGKEGGSGTTAPFLDSSQ